MEDFENTKKFNREQLKNLNSPKYIEEG